MAQSRNQHYYFQTESPQQGQTFGFSNSSRNEENQHKAYHQKFYSQTQPQRQKVKMVILSGFLDYLSIFTK